MWKTLSTIQEKNNGFRLIKIEYYKHKGVNNMNISDIFKLSHGNLNKNSLIPVSLFSDDQFRQSIISQTKYDIPPYKTILEIIQYLNRPISNFYFSDNFLTPFTYLSGPTMVDIPSFKIEELEMCQTKLRIEKVEESMNNYISKKQYDRLFFLIEKKIALSYYIQSFNDIPDDQKYDCFEDIYSRSEYGFSSLSKDFFLNVFKYKSKENLSENIKPDSNNLVKIYRGQNTESTPYQKAFSWTIDFNTAIFFATRFDSKNAKVYEAMVKFDDILAYIDRRGESEVIIDPDCLINPKKMVLYNLNKFLKSKNITENYMDNINNPDLIRLFKNPEGIHGLLHTKRVLLMCLIMAHLESLNTDDTNILIKASLYHDIDRKTDDECLIHGLDSFKKAVELGLIDIKNEEEREILRYIIENHCISDLKSLENLSKYEIKDTKRALNLFYIFKDSDGLDRIRLRDLDTNYLRTKHALNLVPVAYEMNKNIK